MYCLLFLSDYFLAAADNSWRLVLLLRLLVIGGGLALVLIGPLSKTHIAYLLVFILVLISALVRSSLDDSNFLAIARYVSLSFVILHYGRSGRFTCFANSFFAASVLAMAMNLLVNPRDLGLFQDVYEATSGYYGRAVWFTGYRNSFGEFFLISTMILLLADGKPSRRRLAIGLTWGVVGFGMSAHVWAGSSMVVILAMLIGIAAIKLFRLSIVQSVIIGAAFQAFVLISGPKLISAWVSSVLHRDATLTGRVYIWSYYLDLIREHLILGSGYYETYLPAFLREYTPHNSLLSVLYSYGLLGLIIAALVVRTTTQGTSQHRLRAESRIISLSLLLFMVRGAVENDYSPILALLALAAILEHLIKDNDQPLLPPAKRDSGLESV